MGRTDEITRELKSLTTNAADVLAAAVVDNDGLMIASAMQQGNDEDSVAAMSAALLGIGERITSELDQGDFEMVMLRAKEGYTVLVRCA
jgi:predicted regulator of Ras-like GTPase activity (Roadblock/LC7/MglB family)